MEYMSDITTSWRRHRDVRRRRRRLTEIEVIHIDGIDLVPKDETDGQSGTAGVSIEPW